LFIQTLLSAFFVQSLDSAFFVQTPDNTFYDTQPSANRSSDLTGFGKVRKRQKRRGHPRKLNGMRGTRQPTVNTSKYCNKCRYYYTPEDFLRYQRKETRAGAMVRENGEPCGQPRMFKTCNFCSQREKQAKLVKLTEQKDAKLCSTAVTSDSPSDPFFMASEPFFNGSQQFFQHTGDVEPWSTWKYSKDFAIDMSDYEIHELLA